MQLPQFNKEYYKLTRKKKDAAVQEFLDYINTLKQKYPNFKFKESKIVCQPDEVDKVITEQKKQIEQSIKEYEEALKNQEVLTD